MYFNVALLLALPATLIAAIPAQITQEPFSAPAPASHSRWRSLSDRLIESFWGDRKHGGRVRIAKTETHAPPHTLARYGGDVVVRFNISSSDEAKSLAEAADTLLLDVWEYSADWVDIRLAKDIVGPLLGLLPESLQHSHAPLLQERELAQAVYETYPSPRGQDSSHRSSALPLEPRPRAFSPALQTQESGETNIFFSNYQPLSVIDPWMRLLASLFDTHVRKVSIGTSSQGRDIPALRIGVHPTNDEDPNAGKRKTVLIVGGLHAREWISTTTANYVAYNLITGYGKNQAITKMLEDFDFVFVPTANPDGYAYTWETDRLWRKNRQRTNFRFCQGVDIDRSFGFQWDGDVTTAGNPCSESFAGEEPFEAVEAKQLAEWAKNETESNNVDFIGFLDLHSYSQQILYPYSYSCEDTPPGLENLEELAIGLEKAIRTSHGHSYEVMAACEGNTAFSRNGKKERLWPKMEASGGSALDWFYHEMKVRFAYQIKLRDRGTYGFLLPKENIVPTGKEILDAVLYFGGFLQDTYEAERNRQSLKEEVEAEPVQHVAEIAIESFAPASEQDGKGDEEDWLHVEDIHWEMKRRRRR